MASGWPIFPSLHIAPESMTTLKSLASMLSPQISQEIGSESRMVCSTAGQGPAYKGCLMRSNVSHFNSGTRIIYQSKTCRGRGKNSNKRTKTPIKINLKQTKTKPKLVSLNYSL